MNNKEFRESQNQQQESLYEKEKHVSQRRNSSRRDSQKSSTDIELLSPEDTSLQNSHRSPASIEAPPFSQKNNKLQTSTSPQTATAADFKTIEVALSNSKQNEDSSLDKSIPVLSVPEPNDSLDKSPPSQTTKSSRSDLENKVHCKSELLEKVEVGMHSLVSVLKLNYRLTID